MPRKKKPHFTLFQHAQVGQTVKDMYKASLDIRILASNAYPNNHAVAKACEKAYKTMLELKNVLDNNLNEDHGEEEDIPDIYYGDSGLLQETVGNASELPKIAPLNIT